MLISHAGETGYYDEKESLWKPCLLCLFRDSKESIFLRFHFHGISVWEADKLREKGIFRWVKRWPFDGFEIHKYKYSIPKLVLEDTSLEKNSKEFQRMEKKMPRYGLRIDDMY